MNIICHESPFVDSVFHIESQTYKEDNDFIFIGAPSVHEHIIINDQCAIITFEIDGNTYQYDGDMVCGKFTHAPKIKILFKNFESQLTIIRLTPCGMYNLIEVPMMTLVNHVAPASLINIDTDAESKDKKYIRFIDSLQAEISDNKAYRTTQEIIRYVNKNFANLPSNASKEIAQLFGISESSLRRYFKKYLGINLSTYLITVKRKKMIQAIYENNYDSLIVRQNGYYDQSHFLNDFKRLYGVPLKEYFLKLQSMKEQDPELMRFLYHCNIESDV